MTVDIYVNALLATHVRPATHSSLWTTLSELGRSHVRIYVHNVRSGEPDRPRYCNERAVGLLLINLLRVTSPSHHCSYILN